MTAPPPNHPLVIALLVAACSAAALSGEPENAAPADRSVGLDEASWTAQPSWLGNPADVSRCAARRVGNASAFEVSSPGRGMKWSWNLPRPVALDGYRYVAMRYRAAGLRSWADYAVCGLGTPRDGGPDYETLVPVGEIVADGRWHTVNVDLAPVAQRIPTLSGLAVQVQAVRPGALLEVSRLEWVRQRRPRSLADSLTWQLGARFDHFAPISLGHAANTSSRPWRQRWLLADWFTSSEVTAEGVPFRLVAEGPDLAATTMAGKSELRLPVDQKTAEVYALLLADFTGSEEPAYGTGRLTGLADVDRFRLRLEYADGTVDQCLPMDVVTGRFGVGQGVQVVVAATDARKPLETVVLCDRTRQGAFALAALTVGTGPRRLFPAALDERRPLLPPPISPEKPESAASPLEVRMRPTGPPVLERLIHPTTGWSYLAEPAPLVKLRVDGQDIAAEDLQPSDAAPEGHADRYRWYRVGAVAGLWVGVDLQPSGVDTVRFAATIVNTGEKPHTVDLTAPIVGPYRLGEEPRDAYYLFPQRGTVFDNRPCALRQPYSGMFPLQFV
ncbi:MAG: hypothetical protein HQ581_00120, partial [Planctomycetes bacterium]|nr:hypothetical protein [Planctomycetota bacterium]